MVSVGAQAADRGQGKLPKFDLGPFRLQRNLAAISGGVRAVIHQVAVDPDSDGTPDSLDYHGVPLTDGLLGTVGQVEDAPPLAPCIPPLRRGSAPFVIAGLADVFTATLD